MKRFWKIVKNPLAPLLIGGILVAALAIGGVGIVFDRTEPGVSTISPGSITLTIGTEAHAAGTADHVTDGTDDDVQFQAALDALPTGGGRIVILAGTYSFSANVSRAIDNVTWEGVGRATNVARDGSNAVFDVGSQSDWVFRDMRIDAGGIDTASATRVIYSNVLIGTTFLDRQVTGDVTPFADSTNDLGAIGSEFAEGHMDTLFATTANVSAIINDGAALTIQDSVAQNIELWGTSAGTGRALSIAATDADAGNTLRDTPTLSLDAYYWTGAANQQWAFTVDHDMVTAGGTPQSQVLFNINGVTVLSLGNDNGVASLGAFTLGGTVSGAVQTLNNLGMVYIRDTANADMTLGLTINQLTFDDEFLAGKSSDVDHGLTSLAETDTFSAFQKASTTGGGLTISAFSDTDIGTQATLLINAYAFDNVDTTKATSATAIIRLGMQQISGSTPTGIVADGNIFALRPRQSGGSLATVFIVDEDGDVWQTGDISVVGGDITLGVAGTTTGTADFSGSSSGTVTVTVNATAGTWTMMLPIDNGDAGEQLQTNGSGVTSWEAAGSLAEYKDIQGTLVPTDALDAILNTQVVLFNYRDDIDTITTGDYNTLYAGVLGDAAPWVMHHDGKIFSPVSAFGYTVAAFQAMQMELDELRAEIELLKRRN